MEYTVGEMAKRLGINPSTLRYYDKEGLLPFVQRSAGGKRIFTGKDYALLRLIECLKKTGMQLCDIKAFVQMTIQGDETIEARLALMQKQRSAVLDEIHALKAVLEVIEYKCWYYERAKEAGTTAFVDRLSPSQIPPQFHDALCRLQSE